MLRPTARYVLPEFTERTAQGTRTMDPYSKLLGERIIFLGTPIDDASANAVMAQFIHLEHAAPDEDISLYINSPGGSFTAMTAIYDTMHFVSCDVETVCLGQAASSAAVLLAAGAPGKRLALPGARVLIHQPSFSEPVQGQASDLQIQAAEMLRTRDVLEEMLAKHTGQTRERIATDIERDKIFDAPAAQEYGLIDQITRNRKLSALRPAAR
ncbi:MULTISPECIES: ATP-dependent Clp protease proteolytic subunit [unclassified Streptomyces]|uniref:ATP-dependent Clp protease proteolytic subunit n=1 Tax=unclassified Streptomyces TaxID=2593676 RepID=UPI0008805D4F|nr:MULTISPECIES: ATP-dependent Clp protease proteolytic subunit [unclassified Streptomyces]PBC86733.1 ATP-dependent Clp protease protease subunit [Streptomyces sp. 2321.6]SDQ74160.1 ATP-dependent Clp protease, protease subunit [Streptomyces sp. KS_16]SED47399.1 ATP-dependent Clp protease, protease subunit [Streptomyces sp. 2112.3]SEE07776.1 ATP-dependent Clp protease, protease subunit [Streptomyces sp. 2133.1]SNC73909.1 ATP-dependent Clp protease, protease subunit [Streptomyces sp. 2114.4]